MTRRRGRAGIEKSRRRLSASSHRDPAPRLPRDVDLVLAIGLAKRPADRFPSADELARALADALTGQLAPAVRDRGLALVRTGGWADPPAAAVRRRLASG